jgi:hypothetical protein
MYEAKLAGRNGVRSRCLMSSFERHLSQLAVQRRFSRWLVQRGVLDRPSVSRALLRSRNDQLTVGDLARQTGMLDADEIAAVSAAQERIGTRFGETAARLGLLSLPQLGTLLALQQENPRDVAVNLARMGLVDAREVQSLLNEYERDIGIERELQPA